MSRTSSVWHDFDINHVVVFGHSLSFDVGLDILVVLGSQTFIRLIHYCLFSIRVILSSYDLLGGLWLRPCSIEGKCGLLRL